jgi:hypothetical protein
LAIHTGVGSELVQGVIIGLVHDVSQRIDRSIPGCESRVLDRVGQCWVFVVACISNSGFEKVELFSLLPINVLAAVTLRLGV